MAFQATMTWVQLPRFMCGIYPEIPGLGGFTIGTPMFPRATMHLRPGSTIDIVSKGKGVYVYSVEVNSKSHPSGWLKLAELSKRQSRIEFRMQPEPNQTWATQPEDFPPSFDVTKSSPTGSKTTEDRVINRGKPRSGE